MVSAMQKGMNFRRLSDMAKLLHLSHKNAEILDTRLSLLGTPARATPARAGGPESENPKIQNPENP